MLPQPARVDAKPTTASRLPWHLQNAAMSEPHSIDITQWPRRAAFQFFRGFDKPWFSVCTRLNVAALKAALASQRVGSFWLAYHFIAMQVVNQTPAMRLRFTADGQGVRVLDLVHAGTTVLRSDTSFAMLTLRQTRGYAAFCAAAQPALETARALDSPFLPVDTLPANEGLIHTTTLPWIHFTSFDHARPRGVDEDVPKIAFGRAEREGARLLMPIAVEVNHALADGLHVGLYLQALQAALDTPQDWLAS